MNEVSSRPLSNDLRVLTYWYSIVRKNWRLLTILPLAIMVLTAGLSLLIPNKYRAVGIILPPTGGSALPSGLSQLASLGGLSTALGRNTTSPETYRFIAHSHSVLDRVMQEGYQDGTVTTVLLEDQEATEKNIEDVFHRLQKSVSLDTDQRTNVTSIAYIHTDPEFASFVINSILSELDRFLRQDARTTGKEKRIMIESRMKEVKDSLQVAEDQLTDFSVRNRDISQSPELRLQFARLQRQIEVMNAIYIELRKNFELSKIEEVQDTPILSILDYAQPPKVKFSPSRLRLVILVWFLSFVGTLGFVMVRQILQRK